MRLPAAPLLEESCSPPPPAPPSQPFVPTSPPLQPHPASRVPPPASGAAGAGGGERLPDGTLDLPSDATPAGAGFAAVPPAGGAVPGAVPPGVQASSISGESHEGSGRSTSGSRSHSQPAWVVPVAATLAAAGGLLLAVLVAALVVGRSRRRRRQELATKSGKCASDDSTHDMHSRGSSSDQQSPSHRNTRGGTPRGGGWTLVTNLLLSALRSSSVGSGGVRSSRRSCSSSSTPRNAKDAVSLGSTGVGGESGHAVPAGANGVVSMVLESQSEPLPNVQLSAEAAAAIAAAQGSRLWRSLDLSRLLKSPETRSALSRAAAGGAGGAPSSKVVVLSAACRVSPVAAQVVSIRAVAEKQQQQQDRQQQMQVPGCRWTVNGIPQFSSEAATLASPSGTDATGTGTGTGSTGSPAVLASPATGAATVTAEVAAMFAEDEATAGGQKSDEELWLECVIGRGGFGVVYLGTWRGLPVAVKTLVVHEALLGNEGRRRQRAVLEAAVSSALSHANVVQTYAFDVRRLGELPGMGRGRFAPPALEAVAEEEHPEGQEKPLEALASPSAHGTEADSVYQLLLIQAYCEGGSLWEGIGESRSCACYRMSTQKHGT